MSPAEQETDSLSSLEDRIQRAVELVSRLRQEKEAALEQAVIRLIREGLVDSAHDCSDGGIAVALAEKAFPKNVGARVNLASGGLFPEFVLWGEDAGRIVLSCDPANIARIQSVGASHEIVAEIIGETIPDKLEIALDGKTVVSAALSELRHSYESALESALRTDPELVTA